MPISPLVLDYTNVLDTIIGPTHGLGRAEIKRSALALKDVIVRVNMVRVARKNLSPALIVHARDRHPSARMHELTALELSRVIREQGVFSDPAPERR